MKDGNDGPKNIFLWGSSGTGKTLLLVETLKMYLAYFKLQKIKTKVLVIVFHSTAQNSSKLLDDLRKKYVADILPGEDIKIMTMKEACGGKKSSD